MNDEVTPIFTDDNDGIEKIIEENEARDKGPKVFGLEKTLDRVVAPIAEALEDRDLTPEEAKEVARQNDREQHS